MTSLQPQAITRAIGPKSGMVFWPLYSLAVLTGLFFRTYQILDQVLVDDEWHAIHKLLNSAYLGILSDFGSTDFCIPLTLLYRGMADTIGLSEILMRLPSEIAGIAAILFIPFLFRHYGNRVTVLFLAWFLAISPLHIYYSRLARPYAITMLLTTLAILSFYRWWTSNDKRMLFCFLTCGSLSPYFHLTSLPIIGSVFLFAAGDSIFSSKGKPAFTRLAKPLVTLAAVWLILFSAPLVSGFQSLSRKISAGSISYQTLTGAAELFFGLSSSALTGFAVLILIAGIVFGARENPKFNYFLLFLTMIHLVFLFTVRPAILQEPIVLARYSLVLLPFFLYWSSLSFAELEKFFLRLLKLRLTFLSVVPICLGLLFFGPLLKIYYWPNNWINQALFQFNYQQDEFFERYRPNYYSSFYRQFESAPSGKYTLLEAPWHFNAQVFPYYQRIHRQHTLIGFVDDLEKKRVRRGEYPWSDSRFQFRNFVHVGDDRAISQKGIDYVIFHKKILEEMPKIFELTPEDPSRWIAKFRTKYGEPCFEDDFIVVFCMRN